MKKILRTLLALALTLAVLAGCSRNAQAAWKEQYDLGMRLLSEQSYEEAILAFREAIRVDPKREEAYIGLADVYLAQGDAAAALAAVEEGIAQCGESDALTAKREEAQAAADENGEPQAEPEEGGYPLTEEQAAANQTGEDPFWTEDLGEGVFFAPGTTLEQVAAAGLELDTSMEDWMAQQAPLIGSGAITAMPIRMADPQISVYVATENQDLALVAVNSDTQIEGPRGLTIGTEAAEALNRFYCADETVLADPAAVFADMQTRAAAGEEVSVPLYQISDTDWGRLAVSGDAIRADYHTEGMILCVYFREGAVSSFYVAYGPLAG